MGWFQRSWRTFCGWPRWAQVLTGVLVAVVIAAAAGSGKKSPATSKTSALEGATSTTITLQSKGVVRTEDAHAEAVVIRSLKVVASQYQDFGNYSLVTPFTLGNLDHKLRGVPHFTARGQGKNFVVAVQTAGGTTFAVHGTRVRLWRTCTPVGSGCPDGTWTGSSRLALPKVPVLTAADKAHVRRILTASVGHYAHLLALGQQALGTKQYTNANAGLAAFNDPNSAASRFSHYRTQTKAEQDGSYIGAFKKADSYYSATNEPTQAITIWENEMGNAQGGSL